MPAVCALAAAAATLSLLRDSAVLLWLVAPLFVCIGCVPMATVSTTWTIPASPQMASSSRATNCIMPGRSSIAGHSDVFAAETTIAASRSPRAFTSNRRRRD